MSKFSTNYYNTFIEVAEDCNLTSSKIPEVKNEKKTIARMQYELINNNKYKLTSDEILFNIYCLKNNIESKDVISEKTLFFSKGQPCLRTSPLAKKYGFGIHFNSEGKVAIYRIDSQEYIQLVNNQSLKKIKAMRSSKSK